MRRRNRKSYYSAKYNCVSKPVFRANRILYFIGIQRRRTTFPPVFLATDFGRVLASGVLQRRW